MRMKTKLFIGAALGLALAMPAYAQETQAPQDTSIEDEEGDAIVVTGIRGSLERGLEVKRNAGAIVDAISAEELGKFPDTNVAESLQRITGVAITRDRGGEGRFVTVRGLGQEFNLLTYNGRRLATENEGREFSFDVLPSELISAAQIFKSTTANQVDGSIGGLVNIQTPKPLSNPGFQLAGSLSGQYEGLSEDVGIKGSALISNTWAGDTFGILASFSYQQRDIRTDTAESIAIAQTDPSTAGPDGIPGNADDVFSAGTDVNGDGVGDRINSFNANINQEDRERIGATLVLQYSPHDDLEITIDGLYTSFSSPSLSSSYSFFPNPGLVTNALVDSNNDVLNQTVNATPGAPFSNIFDFVARRTESDTETFQIGLNVKETITDRLKAVADVSYSRASGTRDNIGSDAGSGSFFVVSFPGANFTQTTTGNRVPDITFTSLPDINSTTQLSLDQLPASGARLHFSRNSSNDIVDEVFTARLDFDYDIGDTTKLKWGVNYTDRIKNNSVFDNSATQCGDTNALIPRLGPTANGFICDRSLLFSDFLTAGELGQLLTPFNGEAEGFLSGTDANIPRNFQTVNINIVEQAFANLGAEIGQPSFLTPTFNATQSNEIDETIFSGYLAADFEGDIGNAPFKANAGVRFAYTDLRSAGVTTAFTAIVIDSVSGNNNVTQDPTLARVENNDYFEVLPTFNISIEATPNLFVRAGFSRSLSRPTFNDLSTVFAVTQINAGQEQATDSNPLLDPVLSNNLDFSVEFYGDNGLSLSAAGFYKDISNFITNVNTVTPITIPNASDATTGVPLPDQTVNFLISSPQNGDTAEVYGLELAAQKLFDNGFGVSGNITLAESNATQGGVSSRLENISDVSWNASIFYEGSGLQARASLNQRGDFLGSTAGEGGFAEIVDTFTQVDVSLSYEVTENFTVFGEGINILNEQSFTFSERETFLESFIDNGARWLFGVRANF